MTQLSSKFCEVCYVICNSLTFFTLVLIILNEYHSANISQYYRDRFNFANLQIDKVV